ncbi:hypothetical protein GPECTOR_63g14 [Gonium pectorale]|uniref:Uncharacterized protein n=1 Tax=Gonium pectorale TaxID=33097 RepID=A0A150G575_GONPE|nr:hypothetical protein GPECTOR_63g14 [Gonium pectorale]|eukprot:KXZ44685.1 hypothetical protein GPECTOR_63g14 [Gonium pectorale]
MRFVPLADRGVRATVLAVAANLKYFAAAERVPGVEHDQVSVYSFSGEKRVKVLPTDPGVSGSESGRVEGLQFSENSKFLLTQYGNPDWTLVVWRWYSGKVLASLRLDLRPVLSSLFSPVDDMMLAVLGPTSISHHRLDLDHDYLKPLPGPPAWDTPHLTAMCWLPGNMLAAVGTGGQVHVVQEATVRLSTRVTPLPGPGMSTTLGPAGAAGFLASAGSAPAALASLDSEAGASGGAGAEVEGEVLLCVACRGRGFIAAGSSGTVYFFEPPAVEQKRAGVRDLFVLVRRLAVDLPPGPNAGPGPGSSAADAPYLADLASRPASGSRAGSVLFGGLSLRPGSFLAAGGPGLGPGPGPGPGALALAPRSLVRLSVSAGEEEVVAVSASGDVLVASMAVVAEREEKPIAGVVGQELLEGEPFRRLLGGFLTGRVVGLAASSTVPLLAAASADDRQLRVWHYEARRCVASLTLDEEPSCLDMHPGGQLLLLGLFDKIRMYHILLDALEPVFEAPLKRASVVRFSTGGALFAAVGRNNAILLHATYHGQPQLAALRGHASPVTDLAFSADDRMLVSTGTGGAVYFWDLATHTRLVEMEHVDKQAAFSSVVMYNREAGGAVARTADGRCVQVLAGKVEYEVACRGGQYAPACLLGADKVYLAADDSGAVVSHAWPPTLPPRPGFAALAPPPHPYPLHSAAGGGITRMVLLPTKGLLFTASADGCVLMSSVALVLDGVLLEAAQQLQLAAARHSHLVRPSHSLAAALLGGAGAGAGGLGPQASGGSAGGGATAAAAAALGGPPPPNSVPFIVTIPEERLLTLREKVVEVAALVGSARSEAEYQAFRACQVLRDTISSLEGQLEAARQAVRERDATVAKMQEDAKLLERRVVKELESAHMSAAEELEMLYEKRLAVEADKVRLMAAARDDATFKADEAIRRLKDEHARQIQEMEAAHAEALAALDARLADAGDARTEAERFFNEYVKQAEEDFEDHSERINDKIQVLQEAAETREQRLKADNNILKRTNLRLKADKTLDLKRMDKLTADNAALREQSEELRLTISKLTRELEERDKVNADNYGTIQQLRRKVQDLEKHKFVLSYKADNMAKAMEPQNEEIARLQGELDGHGKELLGQMTRAMQQPDDRSVHGRSARQKALDGLVRKYCLGDPRAAAGARDAVTEAVAAAAAAETRVVLLQWRLDQDRRTARVTQRSGMQQNSQLLRELQVAQQDNRALHDRFDAALVSLRELQARYLALERQAGIRHRHGTGLGLAHSPDAQEREMAIRGGTGGGGDADGEHDPGAGPYSPGDVVSMAGRVPPSRPVSGMPPPLTGPGAARSASPSGRASGGGGVRGPGGPTVGSGVARGAPLRAYAELISAERQRMAELAAQLQDGAAAAEEQQRALLGLKEELAAVAAAGGGGGGGGEGVGDEALSSEASREDGEMDGSGAGAGGRGAGGVRFGGFAAVPEASAEGEAAGNGAVRRGGISSAGGRSRRSASSGRVSAALTSSSPGSTSMASQSQSQSLSSSMMRYGSGGAALTRPGSGSAGAAFMGAGAAGVGVGGGSGRRRPSSAGGVGLRSFTDAPVDRFKPPPADSGDLPFAS